MYCIEHVSTCRYKRDIKSKAELTAELKQMQGIIESLNCPIVFAHNDLLLKNVVYNEERGLCFSIGYLTPSLYNIRHCLNTILVISNTFNSGRAYFIDYEYGAFNYLPFDIGNHFCEYAGINVTKLDQYIHV